MSARNLAPPGNGAGAHWEAGAGTVERLAGGYDVAKIPQAQDTTREPVHVSQCVAEFVDTLLDLGRSCGEIPLYGSPEWVALDRLDPRRFAAVVVAAECWRREGEPDAIEARLRHELAEADWLAAWRLRRMSGDLSEAEDWSAIASWTPIAELRRLRRYEDVA